MDSSDPEVIVDQVSNLSATKKNGPASGPFCSSRLILLLNLELWMILFSAEAILASSTSKFGIEIPRIDDEDLNSSTESTKLQFRDPLHCFRKEIVNKYIPRS